MSFSWKQSNFAKCGITASELKVRLLSGKQKDKSLRVRQWVLVFAHRSVTPCPSSWWPGFPSEGVQAPEECHEQKYSTAVGWSFRKPDFTSLVTTWFSAAGVELPALWPLHTVLNLSALGTQFCRTEAASSLLANAVLLCLGAGNVPACEQQLWAFTSSKLLTPPGANACYSRPFQVLMGAEVTFSKTDLDSSIPGSSRKRPVGKGLSDTSASPEMPGNPLSSHNPLWFV